MKKTYINPTTIICSVGVEPVMFSASDANGNLGDFDPKTQVVEGRRRRHNWDDEDDEEE